MTHMTFITLNYHISATFRKILKNELSKLCEKVCKENFNIKLVFASLKINFFFSCKDPTHDYLKSFLIYKFTCASCSSSYLDETCLHFKIRIEEHIKNDNKYNIFKHLHSTTTCFGSHNSLFLKTLLIKLTLNST